MSQATEIADRPWGGLGGVVRLNRGESLITTCSTSAERYAAWLAQCRQEVVT